MTFVTPLSTRRCKQWYSDDEALLIHHLHERPTTINLLNKWVLLMEEHRAIAAEIDANTRYPIRYSTLDVVVKLYDLRNQMHEFMWFIRRIDIHYYANENRIVATHDYFMNVANETRRFKMFRLRGEPCIDMLCNIFFKRGLNNVDFEPLVAAASGGDEAWL